MINNRKIGNQCFRSDYFNVEDCINEHEKIADKTVDFYISIKDTNVFFAFYIPYNRFLRYVKNMGKEDAVQVSIYHQQLMKSINEVCENREQIYSLVLSYIFSVGEMKESLVQLAEPNFGIRAFINENDIYPLVEVISAFENMNQIRQ